jgi:hypothetical protein
MDLVLLFWLMGEPVMEIGPIPGGPEACAMVQATMSDQISAAEPGDMIPFGDGMLPITDLVVSCEPPAPATCPIPENLPDFFI